MRRVLPKVTSGLAVVGSLALTGSAQEQNAVPAFPSRVEVVTLDVVVVDKQGRALSGLAAADFTVFEDGRPQVVVAFEAVDLKAGPVAVPAAGLPGLASPQPAPSRSQRAFVFLIDDLGLDFGPVSGAKKAIAQWLNTRAWPTDDVTILTTSGDLSWNDRVATGREDLLGILGRVQGIRPKAQFVLSEGEAYQLLETAAGHPPRESSLGAITLMDRLMKRAATAGACALSDCEFVVRTTARETHDRFVRSTRAVLASVERLSRFLAPRPGRKSIVVFSEGFARGMRRGEEDAALRASQAANTAVHLVDARGLVADALSSAEFKGAPDPIDVGLQTFDGGILDGAYLAEATGGRILRNTNDLALGLERIADESSIYYRLGYQPEKAPDGQWRKLKVEVRRRKVEARARRGYYASPSPVVAAVTPTPSRPTPPKATGAPTPDPVLATILEKAGDYVVRFAEAFRDVVVQETYLQWMANSGAPRRSKADLVYVGIPGAISWTCLRDVFEVNGQPVREHESRLEKLFLAESRASAIQKADAIIIASAQYNLGALRTVNVPTLPLLFLHPENQHRFRFERKGRRRFGDRDAVEIALHEVVQPTLVNDGERGSVPATGRVFVDPRDGVVLRTEIHLNPSHTIAHLVTDYRFDAGLGIWLPAEMTEQYRDRRNKAIDTEASARYSNYRRFGVTTEERVRLPPN
jgi:VWFA-related protein